MSYVALTTRPYNNGNICVISDRFGGYRTGHRDNTMFFWNKLLSWVASKNTYESISIGLVGSIETNFKERALDFPNITCTDLDLQQITTYDLSNIDILYFTGLPEAVDQQSQDAIALFVYNGGGLFIECPDRGGEYINVLRGVEDVMCESSVRPTYSNAYWTVDSYSQTFFDPSVSFVFDTNINKSDLSSSWSVLMTDEKVIYATDNQSKYDNQPLYIPLSSAETEFCMGFNIAIKNGILTLQE